ncbi:lipoate--protein ligase [Wukongibacter sp. M2B1]|uniref:lipoate--protein ligase n=1 Tax=Wukongibacter sp. M2B1 TaxID=3088895 RepID=UPI003D78DA4C
MKYIKTNWNIPYYNFALEEYLMTEAKKDSYIFFYIHKPSIIVGKHQNTIEEINKEFVEENGIIVARRLSGGGAVYHDEGNLNFSFIQKAQKQDVNNFEKFTRPIINALKELGVEAELSGRNDILVDGKKISGNAQYYKKGIILSHGTLLFNSDMTNLSKALKVKDLKIKSKGIKSVRSRVVNIKDYIENEMSIFELKEFILNYISENVDIEEYVLNERELKRITEIAEEKFSTWDWIWGNSPEYEIQKIDKFPCGLIDIRLNIKNSKIKDCKIYGDFFTKRNIEELETFLHDKTYEKESIKRDMKNIDLSDYFHDLDLEEFIEFLTL